MIYNFRSLLSKDWYSFSVLKKLDYTDSIFINIQFRSNEDNLFARYSRQSIFQATQDKQSIFYQSDPKKVIRKNNIN